MVDLDTVPHHQSVEELSKLLCIRVGKNDPEYFRVLSAYFLSMMASTMRAKFNSKEHDNIPINTYVVCLAESGYGKGKSTGMFEHEFMGDFRKIFQDHVMPNRAEQNLWKIAMHRSALSSTDEQSEYDKLARELADCGEYPFAFDGGSEPAIKQIRQMLLLANCGSINYMVDEIGLNLEKASEALATYLELYDQGRIKQKLTKNSSDNKRTKELEGKTPANMLLFGSPSYLFDGSSIEKKFYALLETGYARRCLFALGDLDTSMEVDMAAEDIFKQRTNAHNDQAIETWRQHFASLADPSKMDWTVEIPDDVAIEAIRYQQHCERRTKEISKFQTMRRTEMTHRYFKTLKVAAAFAFVEESMFMTMHQLHAAMKLVEESGKAFDKVMQREAPYMKLARFIAESEQEQTHADLAAYLPFYPDTGTRRQDMITMATAWGYKQHIIIKKSYVDKIEFFAGETLQETDMTALKLSWSDHFAYGYTAEAAPFDQMHLLTQAQGIHWCNHTFREDHRLEDNVIPGFNMVVLDIDSGTSLNQVHSLLENYTFMTYTTKRHTPDHHRFRLIIPIPYVLELEQEDYEQFIKNFMEWLPIQTDTSANQRSRKWETFDGGSYRYNREKPEEQRLVDVLPFVPRTSKNEQHSQQMTELASLDNLERWFLQNTADGNRSNQMIRYALALVDDGMLYPEIETRVFALNAKLGKDKMTEKELRSTVLQTVAKKTQSAA